MWFLYRTFVMAGHALGRNIMRSALTTLGIIIGVSAVIAMVAIGQGSSKSVQKTIAAMGANNLLVRSGTAASNGVSMGAGSVMTLTPEDARAIAERCPSVVNTSPIVRTRVQVIYGSRNWVPIYIYGTSPSFMEIRDWEVEDGQNFSDQEVENASQVCLIGQTVVREVFGDESPVGKEIRVNNKLFKVVGVLSRKGANMFGYDQDDVLIAPWKAIKYKVSNQSLQNTNQSAVVKLDPSQQINTLSQLYPSQPPVLYPQRSASQVAASPMPIRFANVEQIQVRARSPEQVRSAIKEIEEVLRERHRIQPGDPDDFYIQDMTEMSKALSSTANQMSTLLLSVAFISLIVGGVGIMNIMLVSVTERTREIGLRMAVGARGRDILRQFLVEAIILCLMGGALGILAGILGSFGVRRFLGWPTEISYVAIAASVAVSATVGLVFGYYPAWKASRLDPIEALRYE